MRAIVKPWDEIITCEPWRLGGGYFIYSADGATCFKHINDLEIINEDEWDAEIYALLLLESEVIYER